MFYDYLQINVDRCVLTVYSHSYRNAANAVESLEAYKPKGKHSQDLHHGHKDSRGRHRLVIYY